MIIFQPPPPPPLPVAGVHDTLSCMLGCVCVWSEVIFVFPPRCNVPYLFFDSEYLTSLGETRKLCALRVVLLTLLLTLGAHAQRGLQ